MFITKFIRKDNNSGEEYFYNTAEEAIEHLSKFIDDSSSLYNCVSVSDESKNAVLQIIVFDEEGRGIPFKNDDVVRLKPEFCSAGERHLLYAITNINDKTMRCTITCLNSGMTILPSEVVGLEMISAVGTTLVDILQNT